ncbi:hypothetical protein [Alicyclobacillus sp. SP_1]|uniref:hypothetical protein n=1 Tax=Alicyclobacillus sp. SP_1 TaxID=2942475 RepID=UPI002158106E|nr:hypothetical protein [Alicyclobacillus sp. SP_1]
MTHSTPLVVTVGLWTVVVLLGPAGLDWVRGDPVAIRPIQLWYAGLGDLLIAASLRAVVGVRDTVRDLRRWLSLEGDGRS